MRLPFLLLCLCATPLFAGGPDAIPLPASATASLNTQRNFLVGVLDKELARCRARLKLDGFTDPYFMSFELRDTASLDISASYGALERSNFTPGDRKARVEVRVGGRMLDNTRAGQTRIQVEDAHQDDAAEALSTVYWRLADRAFKKANQDYYKKRAFLESRPREKDRPADFSDETPTVSLADFREEWFDKAGLEERLRNASAVAKMYDELDNCRLQLIWVRTRRIFLNTEGSKVVQERRSGRLVMWAGTQAEDGTPLRDERVSFYASPADIPSQSELAAAFHAMLDGLMAQRQAPVQETFNGPALLSPEAAAGFLHEVMGHGLEGERQKDESDNAPFKDKLGDKIMPAFLSLRDDPSLADWEGQKLWGSYPYDDEGVPAQNAALVTDGRLTGFLLSRDPLKGFPHSNGHARGISTLTPFGRVANLILTSKLSYSDEELLALLRKECKRQGKAYGLYFKRIRPGEAGGRPDTYQSFRGIPQEVVRVDAASGKQELVRGVEIVGTPLNALNKIMGSGEKAGVSSFFCDTSSGPVPISCVSPALLFSELEVQSRDAEKMRLPVLPPPYAKEAR